MQDSVIPNTRHQIKPYRKWANLFNVHSWAPAYYEVNANDVAAMDFFPGAVLLSQDLLGNLTSSAGYSWRDYHAFHAALTYKGLYPVFDFRIDCGGRTSILGQPQDRIFNTHNIKTRMSVRSYIPFSFTRSRWITGVVPQIRFTYDNVYFYLPATNSFQYGLKEMGYSLQAYRYQKTSMRDFAPRIGVLVQGMFQHAPWNTGQLGHIYYMYGRVYLPGVAPHHSLQVSGAWQAQKTERFLFGSALRFPRGYLTGRTEKLSIATIDYGFPICYPDWNLNFLAYLKRLRTNLFCDIAQNQYRKVENNRLIWHQENLRSVGIDLLADVNFLRINFPVNIGIRTTYALKTKEMQPELLFSVSFN